MRDLEEAGRLLVAEPPLPPTPIHQIERRAHGRRRRGRVRAAAALATAVALIAGAVVVAHERTTSRPIASKHSSTTPVTKPSVAPPRDPKLRAHLGLDAPKGWIPADYGDARLWVPPNWKEGVSGECSVRSGPWIALGVSGLQSDCGIVDAGHVVSPGPPSITITKVSQRRDHDTGHLTVNTYSVLTRRGPGSVVTWLVPALDVLITATNASFGRELRTLGPSARAIALYSAPQPVPGNWQRVSAGGISLAVPRSWATRLVTNVACVEFASATVLVGTPNETAKCPLALSDLAHNDMPVDGAWLEPGATTLPGVTPIPGRWDRGMTVAAETEEQSMLTIYVTIGKQSRSIEIGLGPDGRVANAILHSIKIAPATPFGVTGCASKPDQVTLRESSPRTRLVTEPPDHAILCVYGSGEQATEHLLGTASPDSATAADALAGRLPTDVTCPAVAFPWIGILHFDYAGSRARTTVQVGSCLTGNEHGVVLTPQTLEAMVQRVAVGGR